MISVFIQFGGDEAENVGLRFRQYLLDNRLDPFLAGRNSRDIPAGIRDYWGYIRGKIRTSDVMVSICCEDFEGYCGVKKEFFIIDEEKRYDLIRIPFIKNGSPIPEYYENAWHPFYFDVESCEENFCDLLVEIYRWVYIKLVEFEPEIRFIDDNRIIPMRDEV